MKRIDQALLASLDLVFALDANGCIVYISETTVLAFGGDRRRIIGHPLSQTGLPKAIIQQLQTDHREILISGRPTQGDIHVPMVYQDLAKDYEYTFSPVRGNQGSIETTVFIAKDVTERKQAETALQASEAKYRSLFEAASDIILILDGSSYQILNANWAAARTLGYSRQDLLKRSIRDIAAQFDDDQWAEIIERLERDGELIYEHEYRRKIGTPFPAEVKAQFIEYEDQLCIQLFVRDITERKQAEARVYALNAELEQRVQERTAELVASERKLRQLTNSVPGAIYEYCRPPDGTDSFTEISEGVEDLFEVPCDVALSNLELLENMVPRTEREQLYRAIDHSFATLTPFASEFPIQTPSGTIKWILSRSIPYQHENGTVTWNGIFLDITERKQVEFALRESESQLRQIFENIEDAFFLRTVGTGQMIFQNPAWSQIFGMPAQGGYDDQNAWLPVIHPDDYEWVSIVAQSQRRGEDAFGDMEYRILKPDGSIRWIWNRTFPIRNEAGDIYRFAGINIDITERKRNEENLRNLNRELETIFSVLPDLYFRVDRRGTFLDCRSRDNSLLLIPKEELIGQTIRDTLPAEVSNQAYLAIERAIATDDIISMEYPLEKSEGLRYYEARFVRFRDDEVIIIARDITHRKQAEQALATSEERLRTLVNALPFGIWVRDASDRLILQNSEDIAKYGNIMGTRLEESNAPPEQVERYKRVKQRCQRQSVVQYESTETIHGETRTFLRINATLPDSDGGTGIFGAAIDITERKRTEVLLRQSEERFRLLFDHAPIGIVMSETPDFTLKYSNTAFQRLLGYSAGELANLTYEDITHPDDLDLELPLVRECFEGDRTQYQLEKRYIHKDQHELWVSLTVTVLKDENGQLQRGFCAVEDITDRKRSELARQAAQAALMQAEARQRLILEAIPDLMHLFSADGTLLAVIRNDKALNIVPDLERVIGQKLTDFCPLSMATRQVQGIQDALETGEIQVYEQQIIFDEAGTPDAHLSDRQSFHQGRYEEVRIVPASDDQALIMVRDITDRKQAELALSQSEARQRTILTAIPDILAWVNKDGICLDWFRGYMMHDLVSDSMNPIGQPYRTFLPPEIASRIHQAVQQAIATGTIQYYEQSIQVNGTVQHEEVRVVPAGDDLALIIVKDIGDRKALEESLRRSQSTLKDILDNIDSSIIRFYLSKTGEIQIEFISMGCEQVFGYTADELQNDLSLWMSSVIPEDLNTIVRPSWQRVCEVGQDTVIYRFRHKDGQTRRISTRAIAHRDDDRNGWLITAIETSL